MMTLLELYKNSSFSKIDDISWDNLTFLQNSPYVPQCSHLNGTLIALDDTYEESGYDCLFIQELIKDFKNKMTKPFDHDQLLEAVKQIEEEESLLYDKAKEVGAWIIEESVVACRCYIEPLNKDKHYPIELVIGFDYSEYYGEQDQRLMVEYLNKFTYISNMNLYRVNTPHGEFLVRP